MTRNDYFEQVGIVAEQLRLASNAAQQLSEFSPQTSPNLESGSLEQHIAALIRNLTTMLEARERPN